jgi:hypothetical protein
VFEGKTILDDSVAAIGAKMSATENTIEKIVSRADIFYHRPVTKSWEGLPVGNGRMGTLVWTRNTCIEMQINRNDFFSQDSTGTSGSDSCCACAAIRIDFGKAVFRPRKGYLEHLRLHDGRLTISADGIEIELLCLSDDDILLIRVVDSREAPLPVSIEIERPRQNDAALFFRHRYEANFHRLPGKLSLRQAYSEDRFFSTAAVGVTAFCESGAGNRDVTMIAGGSASHSVGLDDQDESITSDYNHQARMLVTSARAYTIAVSSAATFDTSADVVAAASDLLDGIKSVDVKGAIDRHTRWWRNFWSKSYIHLTSEDGKADFIERCYTYYLYLMAASSRGSFPPKFNGMLWSTRGITREWGAQYWLFNEEAMYYPLSTANHAELSDPYFNMYAGMIPAAKTASRQRWGSRGIYIPETGSFNGPAELPEDIATYLRAINYGEIPYDEMPEELRAFLQRKMRTSQLGQFLSEGQRWAWIAQIVSSAAEISIQAWQRYECTGDVDWLKEKGYPFLKGAVEFYRNLPTMKQEADGRLHLSNTNVHEAVWGARDSIYDLAVLRACIPMACRASEVLQVDDGLRTTWRKFLDDLTGYPSNDDEDAAFGLGPGTWAACRMPTATGMKNVEQVWLYPVFFEDWTLLSQDRATAEIVARTYAGLKDRELLERGVLIALHSRMPVMMAKAGRSDDIEALLPVYLGTSMREPPNGLSLWEGLESMTAEHLGLAAYALQESLLQSCGPAPGMDPVINLFPAWPNRWNAKFSLVARGGFIVAAEIAAGVVGQVRISSELGNTCRIRNPWPGVVQIYRNGQIAETAAGTDIEISTSVGESLCLVPEVGGSIDVAIRDMPVGRSDGVWELNFSSGETASKITIGLEADIPDEG